VSDAELAGVIVEIHQRSRGTYGAPRVQAELARLGRRCSRKLVARLMRPQQLVGVHARRRWRRGRPDTARAPDLVQRNFNPTGPDRLWAADVTQFRTAEGWLHLAAVIDLWSRRVVGWAMSTRPNTDLVTDALVMAFHRRRPDRRVVHHSDRGAALRFKGSSQRCPCQAERRSSSRASAGVLQLRVLRGLVLSACATASRSPREWRERSVPFGKYWRRSPLVFSFVPRCQGLCGSQK